MGFWLGQRWVLWNHVDIVQIFFLRELAVPDRFKADIQSTGGILVVDGVGYHGYLDLIWLVVWNMNFIFPYIGNNNPNWLSYFSEGWLNHQPVMVIWTSWVASALDSQSSTYLWGNPWITERSKSVCKGLHTACLTSNFMEVEGYPRYWRCGS